MVANILPEDPHWGLDIRSKFIFAERGHVAYQFKQMTHAATW